jgi:hypothetical protein
VITKQKRCPGGAEAKAMRDNEQGAGVERSYSLGERVLVLVLALAAFGYFLYRVFQPWDPWPEDTFWLRVAEAGFIGIFVLWAAGLCLWPKRFAGVADGSGNSRTAAPPPESGARDR